MLLFIWKDKFMLPSIRKARHAQGHPYSRSYDRSIIEYAFKLLPVLHRSELPDEYPLPL